MVLNHCTICSVYETADADQKRIPVKCAGEQILLLLKREQELSDTVNIRIDFFDSEIGCIKAHCAVVVRSNYDPSIPAPWVADCDILDVIEIVEARRSLRSNMEKETIFSSPEQAEFGGIIQNISEGGIYFITRTKLQYDGILEFSYCFVETEYRMKALIIREEVFRDGRFGYGCRFLEFPKGAERDIKRYLHMRQSGRVW